MKEPDKLYVVPMKTENQDAFVGLAYELDKLLVRKTEYIRKDALLEWLNEAIVAANSDGIRTGFKIVLTKIESL